MTLQANSIELKVTGAGCASCVAKIEQALVALEQVESAQMNFADRSVLVKGECDENVLIRALEAIGYQASVIERLASVEQQQRRQQQHEQAEQRHYHSLLKRCVLAFSLAIPLMFYSLFVGDMSITSNVQRVLWSLVAVLSLMVMWVSARHFYLAAWQALLKRSASMDSLISLGTGAAFLYSLLVLVVPSLFPVEARYVYFEASLMIVALVNLGLALEAKARGRTSQAIKRLLDLQVKSARIIKGEQEFDVALEQVQLGDVLRIRPGEQIPVDAQVLEGQSRVDEAMLSGEPSPVLKLKGDHVSAGTFNKNGSLIVQASAIGQDTALAQIIRMVRQAQNTKLPIARLADSISAYFVPVVVSIALISGCLWLYFGAEQAYSLALVTTVSVLIIACPCALGLATPISVMVGVAKAAEFGVLIRNGQALQKTADIDAVIFDKTGTLTLGKPCVSDIISLLDHRGDEQSAKNTELGTEEKSETENRLNDKGHSIISENELLSIAAALELGSEHRLAEAIVEHAQALNLDINGFTVTDFQAHTGLGVEACINASDESSLHLASAGSNALTRRSGRFYLGNWALLEQVGIDLNSDTALRVKALASGLAEQAKTPMYLTNKQHLLGLIAVADPVKEEADLVISNLKEQGVQVHVVSGDNRHTVKALVSKLKLEKYCAEALPADKVTYIKKLQRQGVKVLMVGDGINDAPALAEADVGMAIGKGTDIAIESADIVLMRDSLLAVIDAITVSKVCLKNIKQNLWGAFIYNSLGIPIAAGILYPFWGMLLNPMFAGAAMALSSVTVVSNANRLRFLKHH
ncbi:heavy metal translocating P-type ATPase [Agaribacterium sp. ZY112]|uniref:heavy metal translocating P-type ATPase n=1 Tax=Agaribacterium sp. ZY112 TaxID=3233574 RepID=UPI003523FDC6